MKQYRPAPFLPSHLHWQPLPGQVLPAGPADWIRDLGSLTARLRRHGHFSVQPLRQRVMRPSPTEARLAGVPDGRHALIREVLLQLDGEPVVYARSTLPLTSLQGANRVLGHMGRRSLGWELFRLPSAHRQAVWVCHVDAARLPAAPARGPVWGRATRFVKRDAPLLVAEFFLPALWRRLQPDSANGV